MDDRLDWVWYAFTVAWIIHVLYLVSISTREKKLRAQLDYLKALLNERENKVDNK